jgi:hypothetical protein
MGYQRFSLVLFLMFFLTSCGGSGGVSVTTTPVVGYVVDAPVQGLTYSCGALTGTTGSDGSFLHDSGAACTFKIGNVTVGAFNSAPTDGVVTPHDLAGVSRGDSLNPSAVAIAQFLQSLDDGTGSGRIKIPDSVVTALSGVPAQKIVDGTTTLSQNALTNLVSTATNNTKNLVSAATAGAAMNTYIQNTYPLLDTNKGAFVSKTANTDGVPTLIAPPPLTLTTQLNTLGLTATTDISANGYYVVLPASASAPNKWQIVAGTDSANNPVSLSGSFSMSAGTAVTQTISGLSFSTDYKVYFVATNASQTSKITDVAKSSVSTVAEPQAPKITSNFPTSLTPISNATSFSVTSDVSGTGYWIVLPETENQPNETQIISGKNSSDASVLLSGNAAFVGGVSKTFAVNGLAYQNAYKLYFVAVNASDVSKRTNVYSTRINIEYTTPTLAEFRTFTSVASVDSNNLLPMGYGAGLNFTPNVDINFYWVVLPSTATAPTRDNVMQGKNSDGFSVTLSGHGNLAKGELIAVPLAQFGSLLRGRNYNVYYVAVNAGDVSKFVFDKATIVDPYPEPVYTTITNSSGQLVVVCSSNC